MHIPLKGWWQVAQRVWTESGRDNLSVVAAGCAFYALFAVFPRAVGADRALRAHRRPGLRRPAIRHALLACCRRRPIRWSIEQIRRLARRPSQSLGWGLAVSLGLALWSVSNLTQAMFAALNIAYEEPERRSLLRFYLSAFVFALLGISSGVLMLLAIVYVPIVFAYAGYSTEFEILVRVGALAAAGAARAHLACAALSLRSLPAQRQMALGDASARSSPPCCG